MQIDFHHAVTYICARWAGFEVAKAKIIAHAAQYVDDATSGKDILFNNHAVFKRITSSHRMLDPKNLKEVANHMVWLPFHFLPSGRDVGQQGEFIPKIVCCPYPDSPVAQDMVAFLLKNKDRPYTLHWLGVTMHVLADTWAHQDFAGILHKVNDVDQPHDVHGTPLVMNKSLWKKLFEWIQVTLLDNLAPPLGHAQAFVYPDMPYLHWKFKNGWRAAHAWVDGHRLQDGWVIRNNTDDFVQAATVLVAVMKSYLNNTEVDPQKIAPLDAENEKCLRACFGNFKDEDGAIRHDKWCNLLKNGQVPGLGREELAYIIGDQPGSWKFEALGTSEDRESYPYPANFLDSNWKHFQDAIQAHRFHLLHDILPKYGICAG